MSLPKPQDAFWTDDQWRAISERGSNLLVAAAAGSGKTAVLVERIIRRITDPHEPIDVDRLLVATFTKAAADEMRHRIRDALELQLAKHRGDEHLSRQLALLNKAAITTLHSFCLEVVETNFYKIPIDPMFRIANETEAELLKSESIEELFEHRYASEDNETFIRLVDCFGGERSDDAVMQLVLRLYEFSRSHPWPNHWLKGTAERFRHAAQSADAWCGQILREVQQELEGGIAQLRAALDICRQPAGPEPYTEALLADLAQLELLLSRSSDQDWNGLQASLQAINFARLKACRGDSYDPSLIETAKELRNSVKDLVTGLRDEFFLRTAEQYIEELEMLSPLVDELVQLVSEFGQRYATKKQDKGLVDFNDLEHYCLAVLRDPASTPERAVPSEIAMQYQQRFAEVLLDEYQDTNRVQEMIIELISQGEGNRFMVGDVKQSIYRFRLAEPSLFLDKYKAYVAGKGGRRIDLSQNFRSRREVVDGVNFIFRQIMYERAAEITYDESAELRFGASYYHVEKPTERETLATTGDELELAAREGKGATGEELELAARKGKGATGEELKLAVGEQGMRGREHKLVDRDGRLADEWSDEARREAASSAEIVSDEAGGPDHAIEVLVADRKSLTDGTDEVESDVGESEDEGDHGLMEDELAELEAVQIEARMIGLRILELTGQAHKPPYLVYDKETKSHRPPTYRDIVILLRASQAWAPIIIEELKAMGIPAYADLSTGYFSATEVQVMMSLLKVIDNPLQDIPLAGVLRSPMFRFSAEQLAQIRIVSPRTSFYEAVKRAAGYTTPDRAESDVANSANIQASNSEARNSEVITSKASNSDVINSEVSNSAASNLDVINSEVSNLEASFIDDELRNRLRSFLTMLSEWRTQARQGSLADLIWRIYRETRYYDLVGGLPGGTQRQANLRALYDRARTYEATSFRGLFRFLRFVERMQDSGADLGTARALGEQEDVVRIMTIHKSKGLEFPIVFAAGLAKRFNEMDLRQSFLLHKEWGLGPKFIDPDRRVSLPSLAWLAVRKQLKSEMLAEEMRILYVALTRAREKLILVASFRDLAKEAAKWRRLVIGAGDTLTDQAVLQARSYADWIFPALVRHPATNGFVDWVSGEGETKHIAMIMDDSRWRVSHVPIQALMQAAASYVSRTSEELRAFIRDPLAGGLNAVEEPADGNVSSAELGEGYGDGNSLERREEYDAMRDDEHGNNGKTLERRFSWQYPHREASSFLSKITVTEIKRMFEQQQEAEHVYEDEPDIQLRGRISDRPVTLVERPSFMEEVKLSATERGTAYHTVMQHVPLHEEISPESAMRILQGLVDRELLTVQQAAAVDTEQIAWFFMTELGQRMRHAERLYREQPFSYRLAAGEVYRQAEGDAAQESILIQGVIDCLFVERDGLVLVDYKTDAIRGRNVEKVAARYDIQLSLYARAVSDIWRKRVKQIYLYFFDGSHLMERSSLLDSGDIIRYD